MFRGKRGVIKCLARKTKNVGVTVKVLGTLDSVIAAIQLPARSFQLWILPADIFRRLMQYSKSKSHNLGAVGQVGRSAFTTQGGSLRIVRLQTGPPLASPAPRVILLF